MQGDFQLSVFVTRKHHIISNISACDPQKTGYWNLFEGPFKMLSQHCLILSTSPHHIIPFLYILPAPV